MPSPCWHSPRRPQRNSPSRCPWRRRRWCEAFASAYGNALTAELGKALRKDADPACLSARSIAPGQLEHRGRDLLVKWGAHLREVTTLLIDPKVYAVQFPAAAELERLKQSADVKRYLALAGPMRQAKVLDAIVEQFSRYVLIARLKLAQISPLATGNEELLAKNPSAATEDALVKYVTRSKSVALQRFLDPSDQAAAASAAAIWKDPVALAGPSAIVRGIENDLALLCIGHS